MGQLESKQVFEGEQFELVPIIGKRENGINQSKSLFINGTNTKIIVVSDSGHVLTSIGADNGAKLNIGNF